MGLSLKKINAFLFFKLPSAYWSGVRVNDINETRCKVSVKHKWINQNPFNSMYFAVQAMAAELTTGALVMAEIQKSNRKISMLVGSNRAVFSKKATGRITFICEDGHRVAQAIAQTIATGEGVSITSKSVGTDESGNQVSEMEFDWSIKLKT